MEIDLRNRDMELLAGRLRVRLALGAFHVYFFTVAMHFNSMAIGVGRALTSTVVLQG